MIVLMFFGIFSFICIFSFHWKRTCMYVNVFVVNSFRSYSLWNVHETGRAGRDGLLYQVLLKNRKICWIGISII